MAGAVTIIVLTVVDVVVAYDGIISVAHGVYYVAVVILEVWLFSVTLFIVGCCLTIAWSVSVVAVGVAVVASSDGMVGVGVAVGGVVGCVIVVCMRVAIVVGVVSVDVWYGCVRC